MKILTNRLTDITQISIPASQFGFRKGMSTLQAASALLYEIEEALSKPKGKYYVVFIDYEKAFDYINRNILRRKLKDMIGNDHPIAGIVEDIMRRNWLEISDEVAASDEVIQTNGVMQGDPISPLLFNIMTADIGKAMEGSTLIMYADDMAIGSANKEAIQHGIDAVQRWASENEFVINKNKTVQMVFRRGGRVAASDTLKLGDEPMRLVNKFKYLGITLQPTAKSFSAHIQERASAAIRAICNIKDITRLKLETAMQLFETVITPIASYGLELVWEKLSASDMERLEKVKTRFMKRALGASKYTPSRMVYMLARETPFLEDLRIRMMLTATEPYKDVAERRKQKEREIEKEFFATDAMTNREWTSSNQPQRHAIIGLATHGFHHKLCKTVKFHQPSDSCECNIVHGMVILLEQQFSFGKTFSGGGKEYIFQNVLVSFRIKPAIDAFYNARSIVRHPPPTRYAKAPRSFTSVHIALIMSETILTIDTDRTFVITRDGCFVGENYISPIEIHSIGSEGKTVDSLCFPQYFHLRSPPAPNTAVPQPADHSL
ncbi:hypothetical protein ANN_20082 [Periplaneta americana]|uniref:Reverse transcriptase domain-containing protein n=1 Tax=Periplaneta americana TaxID=6978 RepID=A0ABQ8SBN7_PERAM|nr:hypothetical protein ANN_20082 [Periplaneta americana]